MALWQAKAPWIPKGVQTLKIGNEQQQNNIKGVHILCQQMTHKR
jgi:hypothetical protein